MHSRRTGVEGFLQGVTIVQVEGTVGRRNSKFSLPITPDASQHLDWLMIALSLIAVVYIGFVALVQQDMKKLIAYSSISHMGFVTLGLFIAFAIFARAPEGGAAALGFEGAMVQMVSHGFISAAMFLCVGVMYDRMHSRMIQDYGGVVNTMPWFATFVVLFALAALLSIPLVYYAIAQWLQTFAYHISIGPASFLLAFAIVFAIVIVTVSAQALKAANANPIKSLQSE